MTGYARMAGGDDVFSWVWEVKSVNGKALDVRMRIPNGWERLDPIVRGLVQKHIKRGNLALSLELNSVKNQQSMQVNQAFLDELIASCKENGQEANISQLLSVRGVVEVSEDKQDDCDDEEVLKSLTSSLEDALLGLKDNRADEGARTQVVLEARVDEIEELVGKAEKISAIQPVALAERMKAQLDEILDPSRQITEDRMAQEVAILITKADVREELDRLGAHVIAARELMNGKGAVGRKLDFLCQEFNREANTLCSKSSDIDLTKIGLALKSAIDQFREQTANIE